MSLFMIGYDLQRAGQNYNELIDAIKGIANGYWHHLDSTWLINSDLTAEVIRDVLSIYLDGNDELLVVRIAKTNHWATQGFKASGNEWLNDNLSSL